MSPTTPGLLHTEAPHARPAPDAGGPIGLVVSDPEQAQAYLSDFPGGLKVGYHVIRRADDVPERLGGLAILTTEPIAPDLLDALVRATLGA